ncbi:cytochrome C peroxidase [Helicobacter aurati]|uniref:Cytochrome C peroxidase n=2 Tax=Helicobacter aurati TaxID=137778 RepID=A0A3D8J3I4_9HELI|nr:cytochrome C peroxidase [Helicobacter aurati]
MILCIIFLSVASGFTDVSLRVQEIMDKANASGLRALPNQSKLLAMQKDMLNTAKMTKEQIELGKILYFDPRLSGNKQYSCNSCHNISLFGTNARVAQDNPQHLLTPTIFNVMFNDSLYYQGSINKIDRADKNTTNFTPNNIVARAVLRALTAENEMRGNINKILTDITKSEEYMSYFRRAYGTKVKVTPELIAESLASFVMTLNTFSRYDDFLAGNIKALSLEESEGLNIFIERGCVACHNGINLGGSMQPFGIMREYRFKSLGNLPLDSNNMLKVPTLRNVTITPPYFHNGAFAKLEDAIREMGQIQIGVNLSNKDINKIIAFLHSLRGNLDPIELPILPFIADD